MNKSAFYIFFFILLKLFSNCSEYESNCTELLNKQFPDIRTKEDYKMFSEDFKALLKCKFDEIEYKIYVCEEDHSSINIVFDFERNDLEDYNDLYNRMINFQKTEEYLSIRKQTESSFELSEKIINPENWEEDKTLLMQSGYNDYQITEIQKHIDKNKGFKYRKVLDSFSKDQPQINLSNKSIVLIDSCACESKSTVSGKIPVITDFSDGQICSDKLNKPILLFFDGYACVNAQKMKKHVLLKKDVYTLINNHFIVVHLYVDDKSDLPEGEESVFGYNGNKLSTVGEKNANLQIQKFNAFAQPFFTIISPEGETIGSLFYTINKQEFIQFLNKAL